MIICWWSALGGEGKTTLAVSQGYQLAKAGYKVALLDFSEINIGCTWALDLRTKKIMPIHEKIEQKTLQERFLEEHMADYNSKLKVFTGVELDRFEVFEPHHFETIIDCLESYNYIIIDTNPGMFFAGTLAGLRKAHIINMVIEPTYRSIKSSLNKIDFVNSRWGVNKEHFRVFVNKYHDGGLSEKRIKDSFGDITVSMFYYYNKFIVEALNQGKPLKTFPGLLKNVGLDEIEDKKDGFLKFVLKRGE